MALTDNLISYYKLEANSNDSVWSNNWTDTSISYVSGKIWNCASFNWSTSTMIMNATDIFWTQPISISLWAYLNTLPSWYCILASYVDSTVDSNILDKNITVTSSWDARFFVYDWASKYAISTASISTWVWNHIVWTYDWITLRVYVNWVLWWTTVSAFWTYNFANPKIWISWNVTWTVDRVNWKIDELWIYSRALSWSEVSQLYNGWAWLTYPFSSTNNASFLFNIL
jgi:hypothetical protein